MKLFSRSSLAYITNGPSHVAKAMRTSLKRESRVSQYVVKSRVSKQVDLLHGVFSM